MTGETSEIEALRAEIATLKEKVTSSPKKPFFDFSTWQESIKTISMPLALLGAIYAFWDETVLGFFGRDSGSIEKVAANIAELQDLDLELYKLQAEGDQRQANAREAALLAKRERLVAETFAHWKRNPGYFRVPELSNLTHYLILQERTNDALEVFGSYGPELTGAIDQVEGKWMESRIFAALGPVQDLGASRAHLDEAFALAEEIENIRIRDDKKVPLALLGANIEMVYAQDCAAAEPFVIQVEQIRGPSHPDAQFLRGEFGAICGEDDQQ